MKKRNIVLSLSALAIALSSFSLKYFHDHKTLEIGAKAPKTDLKMKDVSGKEHALNDLKKENGLLVIFSCNTCPFVIGGMGEGWEGRYNKVYDIAEANNIGMVLVNPNEAKREKGDSFDDMVARAKEKSYKSPYVIDNNHVLADAFGARTTPHVFLFDKNMTLVYVGAIDDNVKSTEDVKEFYLKDAIENLAKGQKIDPNATKNIGCSVKRVAH